LGRRWSKDKSPSTPFLCEIAMKRKQIVLIAGTFLTLLLAACQKTPEPKTAVPVALTPSGGAQGRAGEVGNAVDRAGQQSFGAEGVG
jgi:hypothetical protein